MKKKIKANKKSIRLLFLGDCQTGKTYISLSLINEEIFTQNIISTIGIDKMEKICQSDISENLKIEFKLIIYDTAGQERYRSILRAPFRYNLDGIILLYSMKNRKSFENIEFIWLNFIDDNYEDIHKIKNLWIIGNKFDDDINDKKEEVLEEEGEELAKKYGASFFLFSSKDPYIIKKMNENIIKKIVEQKNINNDFGRKFKMVTKTRYHYPQIASYFTGIAPHSETYEEKVYLDEEEKKNNYNPFKEIFKNYLDALEKDNVKKSKINALNKFLNY